VKVMLEGQDPHTAQIVVENKGLIPDAILPSIFEPFSTSAGKGSGGSGLSMGLYIVRRIIIAHGGTCVWNAGTVIDSVCNKPASSRRGN
jgi:signal transduction histidine kinase